MNDQSLHGQFAQGPQGLFLPVEYVRDDAPDVSASSPETEPKGEPGYGRRDLLKLGGRLLAFLAVVGSAASVEGFRQAGVASARDRRDRQLDQRRRFLLGPSRQAEVRPPLTHLEPDGVTISPVPAHLPTYPLEKSLVDQLSRTFFDGAVLELDPQVRPSPARSLLHLGSQRSNAHVARVFGDEADPRRSLRLDVDGAGRTIEVPIRWNLWWNRDLTLRRYQDGGEWRYNPCVIADFLRGDEALTYEKRGKWDVPVSDILLITVVRGHELGRQIYLSGGHALGTSAVGQLIDGSGDAVIGEIERRVGASPVYQAKLRVTTLGQIDDRSLEVWTP